MSKQAFERKIERLASLRGDPSAAAELRKALRDRNNFFVSKAAAMAAELGLRELLPDLAAAFERFMRDPVQSDPQCWAKSAIAKALKDLDYQEPDFFVGGLKHFQFEPVWKDHQDTATTLRGACALALVACPLPRLGILAHLVDALGGDPAKTVRVDAARAIAQMAGPDSLLLLRLKAICGDCESEVVGQCFAAMLAISPAGSIPFIAGFLDSKNKEAAMEAAAVLGECSDPSALEALEERWRAHKNADVRRAILLSLSASRLESAAGFLFSVVSDGLSEDSAHAIRALAAGRFREDFRERVRQTIESRPNLQAVYENEFR